MKTDAKKVAILSLITVLPLCADIVPFPEEAIVHRSAIKSFNSDEVRRDTPYFAIGVIGPWQAPFIPGISMGKRFQWHHHGLDASVNTNTIGRVSLFTVNLDYLYYFSPDIEFQWYGGIGMNGGALLLHLKSKNESATGYFSPEFKIGNEFYNAKDDVRFVELIFSPLYLSPGVDKKMYPTVGARLGLGF